MANIFDSYLRAKQASFNQGANALAMDQAIQGMKRDRALRNALSEGYTPGLPQAPAMGPTRPGESLPAYPAQPEKMDYGVLFERGFGPEAIEYQKGAMNRELADPSAVREYEYFQNQVVPQGPEAVSRYMALKRGGFSLGGQRYGASTDTGMGTGPVVTADQTARGEAIVEGAKTEAETKTKNRLEKVKNFPKVKKAFVEQNRQWDLLEDQIDQALDEVHGLTAGFAANMSGVKGAAPYNLARRLETIKANIGFDKLQQMRDSSPTGGALGQVSEMENRLLQSVKGSLDQGQDPETLKENLRTIKQDLDALQQYTQEAFQNDYSDLIGGQRRPQQAGQQPPMQQQAPTAAIQYLMKNDSPQMRRQFQEKYGYLPEGM